jgi:ATP-dependent DNA helicase DinG
MACAAVQAPYMSDLRDIFGAGGPLELALPGFRPRREQMRMAHQVAEALACRSTLIVEAGTGTGKTFSYLVPALLSGARVLISTGTRALQDQLFAKDLPLVARALGRPARVAVLKGRANYLCHRRLSQAQTQLELGATRGNRMLERVRRWATITRSGDLSEVRGLSDSHPIWPTVTSTRENCLGTRCDDFARCHVAAARRAALEADIVIVNHHLLLADLVLKEDGFGDILGSADALILDEAHQLPDLATQFLGASISSRRIESLIKAVRAEIDSAARTSVAVRAGASDILGCLGVLESEIGALQALLPRGPIRIAWTRVSGEFADTVAKLAEPLLDLEEALLGAGTESPLAQLGARAGELALAVKRIATAASIEGARTVETTLRGFSITLLPFDISERFQALVSARQCAWIFTSATLSVGEDFSHFSSRLGLCGATQLRIESPFNYEQQSLLYLPAKLPDPADAGYVEAVIDTAVPLIDAARGGAFILFTSHRALARGAELLRARWGSSLPYELYVQGEAPRERLLDDFRSNGNAVLLGTASFWEGVDVKGDALRLVVIEKLPFASPEDPLVKARIEHLQMQGANAFRDYQLPEAALALKQGVGRLIRSEEDFGAVVICDPRLLGRSYGRVLLEALPPMSITQDADEALAFLRRHAPPRQTGHAAAQRA